MKTFEEKLEEIKHVQCNICGKDMKRYYDKKKKEYTTHSWICKCMPGAILSVG